MYLRKMLKSVALFATLMLTACGSLEKPGTALPKPLPAEYAVSCPEPPFPSSPGTDDSAVALKKMYDLYGLCAGRFIDLVDWIMGNHAGTTK